MKWNKHFRLNNIYIFRNSLDLISNPLFFFFFFFLALVSDRNILKFPVFFKKFPRFNIPIFFSVVCLSALLIHFLRTTGLGLFNQHLHMLVISWPKKVFRVWNCGKLETLVFWTCYDGIIHLQRLIWKASDGRNHHELYLQIKFKDVLTTDLKQNIN